jgi:hypothetical protein
MVLSCGGMHRNYSSKRDAGVYMTYTHPEYYWCPGVTSSTNPEKAVNRLPIIEPAPQQMVVFDR